MARAMTMKVNRMEAIRLVGAAIRTKTQEYEAAKKAYPRKLEHLRSVALKAAEKRVKEILQAGDADRIGHLLSEDLVSWKVRKDLPSVPELNVCRLKSLLTYLQNDTRKTVPISSEHELWAILQGKCEVIRG